MKNQHVRQHVKYFVMVLPTMTPNPLITCRLPLVFFFRLLFFKIFYFFVDTRSEIT